MSRELKPGDKVMLNSGSPILTVVDVGVETGRVWCNWIDDDGSIAEGSFHPDTITEDPMAMKNRVRAYFE